MSSAANHLAQRLAALQNFSREALVDKGLSSEFRELATLVARLTAGLMEKSPDQAARRLADMDLAFATFRILLR